MALAKTFERAFKYLIPSWLSEGEGGKVWTTITRTVDENVARGRAALEARFPARAEDDALAMIGDDRGIFRGRTETREHYAQRLIEWRYPRGHVVRGSAFALLSQINAYFGGIVCWTIDASGNLYSIAIDGGSETTVHGFTWAWDTGPSAPKGRFWINLTPAVGFTWTLSDVIAIRRLFTGPVPWNPAGTQPEWVIVSTNGTDPTPADTWVRWSQNVAGTQTAVRSAAFRFWSMAPTRNNVYAGNASSYCTQFPSLVSGMKTGNPASFPATITLTTGATYAGNPASYPAQLQLVDDGETLV